MLHRHTTLSSNYTLSLVWTLWVAEGVELLGVRGCRALWQALGVAGMRALDKLLQARMTDGVQQLSAALSSSNTGRQSTPFACLHQAQLVNLRAVHDAIMFWTC